MCGGRYGRIRDIDLKNPSRPPAFAFVSFDEYRAAEDAVRGRGLPPSISLDSRFERNNEEEVCPPPEPFYLSLT